MGLGKEHRRKTFGPQDLGILDRTPSRALDTVVQLCAHALQVPMAGLFTFDDTAVELLLHGSVGFTSRAQIGQSLPLTGSMAARVHRNDVVIRVEDLSRPPFETSVEFIRLGARSYIGCPVRDPADAPIGVLAAMHRQPHHWSLSDAKLLDDMAYLASQQIMLKASFATLNILSEERKLDPN